jgi:multidrug efflux pump subunit AcrA (membrane-fusion protein)
MSRGMNQNTNGGVIYEYGNEYIVRGVISLPESALTEEQGLYFVYLKLDDECYKKQEVQLGTSNGERVEILSGLKDGDTVVTRGAIHVKLAAASNAIPTHSHNH